MTIKPMTQPKKKTTDARQKKRQAQRAGMKAMLQLPDAPAGIDSLDKLNQGAIELQQIPLERLHNNPFSPRKSFDEASLRELGQAIEENGFFGHLVVRPIAGKRGQFALAYGQRRLKAAAFAGLKELPCEVRRDLTDQQMLEFALVENAQREDLNPAEEIEAVAKLKELGQLSMKALAQKLGKSKTWVVERLNIAKHESILEAVRAGLPWTTGTELARIENEEDRALLLDLAIAGSITRDDLLDLRAGRKVMRDFLEEAEEDSAQEEDTPETKGKKEKRPPRIKTSIRRINQVLVQMSTTPLSTKERAQAKESLKDIIEKARSILATWESA